jgi:hypothetical protein
LHGCTQFSSYPDKQNDEKEKALTMKKHECSKQEMVVFNTSFVQIWSRADSHSLQLFDPDTVKVVNQT